MISINKETKVYILCPPTFATGGPELLHQLCHQLNVQGVDAWMFYFPVTVENPVHPNYHIYETRFTTSLDDSSQNVLIVPEVMVEEANKLKFHRIRKYIWWLSVDNFFHPLTARKRVHRITAILGLNRILKWSLFYRLVVGRGYDGHLVQSEYARAFLKRKGISSMYLSDYLNEKFIFKNTEVNPGRKENIVLFNPKKGVEFTQKLIAASGKFKWVPLIGLTPEEVSKLLLSAKVYVDFGEHPGKDRFPREAAISGCCVITGLRGSAGYYEDVCVPELYKIADQSDSIPKIIKLIESCFTDYDKHNLAFTEYRNKIANEERRFVSDVKAIFDLNTSKM